MIELLPLLAFAAVAYFVLPLLQPRIGTRLVAEVIVRASVLARSLLAVARVVLLSSSAPVRLSAPARRRGNYLYIWTRRFSSWAVYGYALADAALVARRARRDLCALLQQRGAWCSRCSPSSSCCRTASGISGCHPGPAASERRRRERLAARSAIASPIPGTCWRSSISPARIGVYVLRRPRRLRVPAAGDAAQHRAAAGRGTHRAHRLEHSRERGFAISPISGALSDARRRAPTAICRCCTASRAAIYLFAGLALLQAWGARHLRLARHRARPPGRRLRRLDRHR